MRDHELEVDSSHVLMLTQKSGLSAYDCEYVALAQQLGIPLVTSDARIIKAFPTIAVAVDSFSIGFGSR